MVEILDSTLREGEQTPYVNFLVDEKIKTRLEKEIDEKTICLNEILNRNVTYEETSESLLKGFQKTLNLEFSNQLQCQP